MDENGKLSNEDIATASAYLNRLNVRPCRICGSNDLQLFPFMLGEEFFDAEGSFLTSATLGPKIRLTCHDCGNILYFAAEPIGVAGIQERTDG